MPADTPADPVAAALAAIAADLRLTGELQSAAGHDGPSRSLRHALRLLKALDAALKMAAEWQETRTGPLAETRTTRQCGRHLAELISWELTGEEASAAPMGKGKPDV